MATTEPTLSPQDQKMADCFNRFIRYEAEDSLFVSGEKADYLLETDLVYAYPRIPPEHLANAKMRFNVDPYTDGAFLCVTLDKRRDVPMDNCLFTTRGLHWWDATEKKVVDVPYPTLQMAFPLPDYPNRGVKVSLHGGREIVIRMYLHDALLNALANFLCNAQSLSSRSLVDLNNATAEQMAALPMMTLEKAARLIAERDLMQGFKKMDQVGAALHMHFQELSLLAACATLKPYRAPKQQGRRVDF